MAGTSADILGHEAEITCREGHVDLWVCHTVGLSKQPWTPSLLWTLKEKEIRFCLLYNSLGVLTNMYYVYDILCVCVSQIPVPQATQPPLLKVPPATLL